MDLNNVSSEVVGFVVSAIILVLLYIFTRYLIRRENMEVGSTIDKLPYHEKFNKEWLCNCYLDPAPVGDKRILWDTNMLEISTIDSDYALAERIHELMISPPLELPNFISPQELYEEVTDDGDQFNPANVFDWLMNNHYIYNYFTFNDIAELQAYVETYAPAHVHMRLPDNVVVGDNDILKYKDGNKPSNNYRDIDTLVIGVDENLGCFRLEFLFTMLEDSGEFWEDDEVWLPFEMANQLVYGDNSYGYEIK